MIESDWLMPLLGELSSSPPMATSPELCSSDSYEPTTADILLVKQYFKLLSIPLPDELIDVIIDVASYWARTSVTVNRTVRVTAHGTSIKCGRDRMYMRTLPLAVYGAEGDFVLNKKDLEGEKLVIGGLPPAESNWVAPARAKPFRKIEFQLWSHDQGWVTDHRSRRATYEGSFSWFDASVERLDSTSHLMESIEWPSSLLFTAVDAADLPYDATYACPADVPTFDDPTVFPPPGAPFGTSNPVSFGPESIRFTRKDVERPFLPSPTTLQKNIVAKSQTTHHIVTWTYLDDVKEGSPEAIAAENNGQGWKSYDGSFVRDLQVGDCITLWMRARFPGWSMNGVKAKITVYWAV
ncbi:hypothetical protein DFH29DRAFT_591897 [Suillus ampliporus]|nr:hypothetical protein DFH29DRAFT_591897 [Suillus ampliporus]